MTYFLFTLLTFSLAIYYDGTKLQRNYYVFTDSIMFQYFAYRIHRPKLQFATRTAISSVLLQTTQFLTIGYIHYEPHIKTVSLALNLFLAFRIHLL